jgi:hypothetical protein
LITFSGFKLPHYINIIFPSAAVLTAGFLLQTIDRQRFSKGLLVTQLVVCVLCLLAAVLINTWAFPLKNWLVVTAAVVFLGAVFFIQKSLQSDLQKIIGLSALTSVFIFYLLNSNFYPQLLTYQAGNELAFETRKKVDPKNVYLWPYLYNPSFQFYSKELKKDFSDSVLSRPGPIWVLTDRASLPQLKERNLPVLEQYAHYDYNIGTMTLEFINPKTRQRTLDSLFLIRIK